MTRRKRWWLAVGLYAVCVTVLSLAPTRGLDVSFPHLDKLVHLGEYLVFAWLLARAIRLSRLEDREYRIMAWMFATTYGMFMEVIQLMVPWRSADWVDVCMNALGAGIGVSLGDGAGHFFWHNEKSARKKVPGTF